LARRENWPSPGTRDIDVVGCAMRRVLVLLVLVACRRTEPQPREHVATPKDAAVAVDARAPKQKFRTADSTYHVDPKLAGKGKTSMVASEDRYATQAGEDALAAGGNAVDAAVATAFVLAVTHPSAGNLAGGGFAVVRVGKGQAAA